MRKSILILFFLFSLAPVSKACLNEYYTMDDHGRRHDMNEPFRAFNTNFNLELISKKMERILEVMPREKYYKYLSDYSVLLMKSGKPKEALILLIDLYNHFPGEWVLAANLGTAYELNGEVDSALKYIKRDLELNPQDHEGSEWVHVKVLECKLKMRSDPSYLLTHSVLSLSNDQKKDREILNHVEIQARERFPFTPGPDPIMASIMADLADMYSDQRSAGLALALYRISKKYFGNQAPALDRKIRMNEKLVREQEKTEKERSDRFVALNGDYNVLLDDNNKQHFAIDWNAIASDPQKLLSMIDYNEKEKLKTDSVNQPDKVPVNDESPSEPIPIGKWILAAGVPALILLFYLFIRNQKKQ